MNRDTSKHPTLRDLAFDQAPVALSLVRLDGTQLDANPAYVALMGLAHDTLATVSALGVTHPEDRERTAAYLAELATGEITELVTEKTYLRADGTTFHGRLTARPLRNDQGDIVAILGMIHDLTEQDVFDRMQQELVSTQAVARVAADTAHELNNLLGAMTLHMDLAQDSAFTVAMRALLERATQLGASLLHLADDKVPNFTGHDHPVTAPEDARPVVLVVDDEPILLDTVAQALRRSGYEVLVAANGDEALEIARRETFGLLVTDLVMPGMDGISLAQRLRATRPDLPVLFITGYAGGDLAQRLPTDATVLRKPFRALDLVTSVARLQPLAS